MIRSNSPSLHFASSVALVATMALVASGGCKKKDGTGPTQQPDPSASEAVDSTDVAQSEAALVVAAADGATTGAKAEDVAAAAVANAKSQYQPAACVTAKLVGKSTVEYTLSDCTGPFGLVHVSGTLDVDFQTAADGLHFHATGSGLDINGGAIDVDATGVYAETGADKVLTVQTNGKGTGPRGTAITRQGEYVATWSGDGCFGLDGDWTTTVGAIAWDTAVDAFERCDAQCPAAGGSITWTGKAGRSLHVGFDGSDAAKWETSSGRSGTIDLFCGGS